MPRSATRTLGTLAWIVLAAAAIANLAPHAATRTRRAATAVIDAPSDRETAALNAAPSVAPAPLAAPRPRSPAPAGSIAERWAIAWGRLGHLVTARPDPIAEGRAELLRDQARRRALVLARHRRMLREIMSKAPDLLIAGRRGSGAEREGLPDGPAATSDAARGFEGTNRAQGVDISPQEARP